MEVVPVSQGGITRAIEVLLRGGIVVHATETCYGLACDLTNPDAVKKLFDLKKRPYDQPVSALFYSVEDAKKYVVFSERALDIADKYLPGPLTIVLPRRDDAPNLWLTANGSGKDPWIGVRISSHPVARALAEAMKRPIATTSANLHGKPNPYSVDEILLQFADASLLPDLILDSGVLPSTPPSTVLEIVGETLRVMRQGEICFPSALL